MRTPQIPTYSLYVIQGGGIRIKINAENVPTITGAVLQFKATRELTGPAVLTFTFAVSVGTEWVAEVQDEETAVVAPGTYYGDLAIDTASGFREKPAKFHLTVEPGVTA